MTFSQASSAVPTATPASLSLNRCVHLAPVRSNGRTIAIEVNAPVRGEGVRYTRFDAAADLRVFEFLLSLRDRVRPASLVIDADLLQGQSSFIGYDTQRIGAGIELNPWNVLALRAGAYQNIAESDIGPVITLGAGLNLWALRIDLALASSTELTSFKDYEVPDEARLSLGIAADF